MTTYRVGVAGATVFDAEERVVSTLAPGTVVVEGTIESGGSMAQQYDKLHGKPRRTGYDDKRIRAAAESHGIDPDVAERVARAEGGRP